MVPAMMGIKQGQVGRFLIEVYASDAVFSIQLGEAVSTTESMRDFIEHRCFVML